MARRTRDPVSWRHWTGGCRRVGALKRPWWQSVMRFWSSSTICCRGKRLIATAGRMVLQQAVVVRTSIRFGMGAIDGVAACKQERRDRIERSPGDQLLDPECDPGGRFAANLQSQAPG
jgi:hypothetical protein